MPGQGYYGGYSLIRTSTNTTDAANGKAGDNTAAAATTTTTGMGRGFSGINFACCNRDWITSFGSASAAGAPSAMASCNAAGRANAPKSIARATFLHAFFGMPNFYRGTPLRAANNNNNDTKRNINTASSNTTTTTTTTSSDTTNATANAAVLDASQVKKKLPIIPSPIGCDTWSAISDTALTARNCVMAAGRALVRPVAPKAIGTVDADTEVEHISARGAPEPLFRDLLAFSLPLESSVSTAFRCSANQARQKGSVSLDDAQAVKRHHHHHPIPPSPISTHPPMSLQREDGVESDNNARLQQKQCKSPELPFEEGTFVPHALLDEVNADFANRVTSCSNTWAGDTNIPILFQGNNGAAHRNARPDTLLIEDDQDIHPFDADGVEEEDALERIKRVINIVMSVSNADAPSAEADSSCSKTKKGVEFDMDWARANKHGDRPATLFHGI